MHYLAFKIHVTSKFIISIKIKTSLKYAAHCFKIWILKLLLYIHILKIKGKIMYF